MKSLLPSLKERNRYIVFEVISDKKISNEDAFKSIENGCHDFIGRLGMGETGLMTLNFWKGQRGILKADYKNVDKIRSALALIAKIDSQKVVVRSIGVSGTLNKAEKKYLEAM